MVLAAIERRPRGTCPIVIGDMNADLDFPRNRQEEVLSAEMSAHGLACVTKHYRPRQRRRRTKGRWTFRRWEDRAGLGE